MQDTRCFQRRPDVDAQRAAKPQDMIADAAAVRPDAARVSRAARCPVSLRRRLCAGNVDRRSSSRARLAGRAMGARRQLAASRDRMAFIMEAALNLRSAPTAWRRDRHVPAARDAMRLPEAARERK